MNYTPAPKNPQDSWEAALPAIREKLNALAPAKSAWKKGVQKYASDILQVLEKQLDIYLNSTSDYRGNLDFVPNNQVSFEKVLLRGVSNWERYNFGRLSIIANANTDICLTLCPVSEQKKKKYGLLPPNSKETWHDVEVRALKQAAIILRDIARELGYFKDAPIAANFGTVKSRRRYFHTGAKYEPLGSAVNELVFSEKVAAWGTRRIHECRVEIRLKNTEYGLRLTISGDIWNNTMTDIVRGGQCLDSMLECAISAGWAQSSLWVLHEIVDLWKKYHLGGMYSGHKGAIPDEDLARIWNLLNI